MNEPDLPGYAYGDSELAAARLGLVAQVFDPTSRAFLERAAGGPVELAVDLGCGPGYTTRLMADVLRPERTVGLDRSGPFVERARSGAPAGVEFVRHDVREVPFPVGSADLIYSRLLLSHLPDRPEVLARWATQLAPGGRVLLDELEDVETEDPWFLAYVKLASARVAWGGGRLLVGPELEAAPDPEGLTREASDVVTFSPARGRAASIFRMNMDVLIHDPLVREAHSDEELGELRGALGRIEGADAHVPSTWHLRQMVFRRTA